MNRHTLAAIGSIWLFWCAVCAVAAPASGSYPDPERYRDTIQAFLDDDAGTPPPASAIVAVGSSSMRMWHPAIRQDLAPLTIIPRGFGGSNMNDLAYFLDDVVIRYRPRAVMIYEGDNDAAAGVAPARVDELFGQIVARIRAALPGTRIYVLSVKPSISRWAIWPQMRETNRLLEARCDGDPLLTYVDVAAGMLNEEGTPRPEIFREDRLHMTDAGYRIWTAAVRPVLLAGEARFEQDTAR